MLHMKHLFDYPCDGEQVKFEQNKSPNKDSKLSKKRKALKVHLSVLSKIQSLNASLKSV